VPQAVEPVFTLLTLDSFTATTASPEGRSSKKVGSERQHFGRNAAA
jgi:hypothetical protein